MGGPSEGNIKGYQGGGLGNSHSRMADWTGGIPERDTERRTLYSFDHVKLKQIPHSEGTKSFDVCR